MGRSLDDVLASLPMGRRLRVDARAQDLIEDVESLGELRRVVGKAQLDIAAALNVKQPSVSRLEKQADMYVSTLRHYIEAAGGQLDLGAAAVASAVAPCPAWRRHRGRRRLSIRRGDGEAAVAAESRPAQRFGPVALGVASFGFPPVRALSAGSPAALPALDPAAGAA